MNKFLAIGILILVLFGFRDSNYKSYDERMAVAMKEYDTLIMKELKPEYYKNVSSHWIESFIKCTKPFSREKYVLSIKLEENYIRLFSKFNKS